MTKRPMIRHRSWLWHIGMCGLLLTSCGSTTRGVVPDPDNELELVEVGEPPPPQSTAVASTPVPTSAPAGKGGESGSGEKVGEGTPKRQTAVEPATTVTTVVNSYKLPEADAEDGSGGGHGGKGKGRPGSGGGGVSRRGISVSSNANSVLAQQGGRSVRCTVGSFEVRVGVVTGPFPDDDKKAKEIAQEAVSIAASWVANNKPGCTR